MTYTWKYRDFMTTFIIVPIKLVCCEQKSMINEIILLIWHLHTENEKKGDLKCDVCGKSFSNIYNLRRHIKDKHSNEANDNDSD